MKAIIAVNNLGFIGKGNTLLWKNKKDLQHFKELTLDQVLLVGYNTNSELPPLPSRTVMLDEKNKINLLCLAGFMRILSKEFIQKCKFKIINIHPSLLPKYKGLNTHERAIKAGDKYAGSTVHYVTAKLDSGKKILQTKVKILKRDTPNSLAKRVLKEEHLIYPKAVDIVCNKIN